jgi:hypothetical protein
MTDKITRISADTIYVEEQNGSADIPLYGGDIFEGGGSGEGTTDHSLLDNRTATNSHPATAISVQDTGNFYAGNNVESVLAEIGPQLGGSSTYGKSRLLSSFPDTDPTGVTECAAAINAALIVAAAEGVAVVVDGEYLCGTNLRLPNGTTLVGVGRDGSSVIRGTFTEVSGSVNALIRTEFTDTTAENITLDGLTIRGGHDGTSWGLTPPRVNAVHAVRTHGCKNLVIRNCDIGFCAGFGIHLGAVREARIINNYIHDTGRDGCTAYGAQGTLVVPENVVIANNVFRRNGDDSIAIHGDSDANPAGSLCTVTTTAGSTTVVGSGTDWSSADVGRLISITTAGLQTNHVGPFHAPHEATITAVASATELTIDHPAPRAVTNGEAVQRYNRTRNIVITGNTIIQNDTIDANNLGRGICLSGVVEAVVTNNTIRNTCGVAVLLKEPSRGSLWGRNTIVANNTIVQAGRFPGASTSRFTGIELTKQSHITLTGNLISEAGTHGIRSFSSLFVTVQGGIIERCGASGIEIASNGCRHWTVDGVTIRSNNGRGINLEVGFFLSVLNCTILDNVDHGVRIHGNTSVGATANVSFNRFGDTRSVGATQTIGVRVSSPSFVTMTGNQFTSGTATDLNATAVVNAANELRSTSDPKENYDISLSGTRRISGADTPEGAVVAPVGSMYLRSNGTSRETLYIKESGTGNTGWVAFGTFTAAEASKLAGIATGATANATDAQLRDRTTHTGPLLKTSPDLTVWDISVDNDGTIITTMVQ